MEIGPPVPEQICERFFHIQSVQKETQTFKGHFLGVKNIDCKNDSFSVALSFNKELYSEVLS